MNQSAASTRSDKSTDGSLISSDRVEGTKVLDRSGKNIGTIKSLKIAWRKLEYDPGKHGFSTDITKEQLEGAPSTSRRQSTYHASAGGVGTGRRPESAPTVSSTVDSDLDNDDESWDRARERELYDYYVVGYYWDD
jgi:hypothetical protein